jgi:hypothetical protein
MSDDIPAPGATLEAADADASTHTAAEGAETPGKTGSDSTLRDMLLSTDPDKSLQQVESPYDPDAGGLARVYRGVQKATGVDGTPAVVDVIIGAVEVVQSLDDQEASDGDEPDDNGVNVAERGV